MPRGEPERLPCTCITPHAAWTVDSSCRPGTVTGPAQSTITSCRSPPRSVTTASAALCAVPPWTSAPKARR
ncbi:hypothetical protein BBK82_31400 [Lentzea guizhouensis]|uniref:Uncharacterized protein n=1 Tax=Lentzea guizhouensis TaxID=1586287 RepID=A0A1B2HQA9_9PSEU|nr:hypothetical protein [Lentzea guizhouensis]ANZ39882.1 hypothetical protein BBK82_31400 [Lentzea guizhouensis]